MIVDHDLEKQKHSKRLQQKQNHVKRQVKIAKQHLLTPDWSKEVKEPHRLAKRHAMNCGNPKCLMCGNPRKMWHELTIQEKRLFQEVELQRARHSNGVSTDDE
jgi:hypothetical protein